MKPAYAGAVRGVENEVERHSPRGEPALDLGGEKVKSLPASRRDQYRRPRRLTVSAIPQVNAYVMVEAVDLVPNFQQPSAVRLADAQLRQDFFDVERLRFGLLV